MRDIEALATHLKTLTPTDWNKLFDLQIVIDKTEKFGEMKGAEKNTGKLLTMPYWETAKITEDVISIIQELEITPVFDWVNWLEGKSILNNKEQDYNKLDTITLCKLFTLIIRTNRFNDGFLVMNFNNGTISKIIKAIQNNIQK